MGIFRRSRVAAPYNAAINAFWEWWRDVPEEVPTGALAERVAAIHPDLTAELGPGRTLTLTGNGVGELRGITERWLRGAPKKDDWTYHAARQPDPERLDGKVQIDENEFDLQYVRMGLRADARRARVDVAAYHPDFLFVAEETRTELAYRVLVWALGEDDVARWIGDVTISEGEPMDSLPPGMLPAVVEQISGPFTEPAWLTGEGRTPLGHAARVALRFPLHRQDFPLSDLHVAVELPYQHANPDRLPVEPSAGALRDIEERLSGLPGAVLAAHLTGDGKRMYHLYADPDSGVLAELDQLAAGWPEGRAKVAAEPDPRWETLDPYMP